MSDFDKRLEKIEDQLFSKTSDDQLTTMKVMRACKDEELEELLRLAPSGKDKEHIKFWNTLVEKYKEKAKDIVITSQEIFEHNVRKVVFSDLSTYKTRKMLEDRDSPLWSEFEKAVDERSQQLKNE